MSEMENLQILRCGHQYHEACIEQMKKSGVSVLSYIDKQKQGF